MKLETIVSKKMKYASETFTSKTISMQKTKILMLVSFFENPKCNSDVVLTTSKLRFHENETTFFVILQGTKFTSVNRSSKLHRKHVENETMKPIQFLSKEKPL